MATPTPSASNPLDSSSSDATSMDADARRTLVIVLATVLSAVALIVICTSIILIRRYRHSQFPFSGYRGKTPIDDDEIATWRTKAEDLDSPSHHRHTSSSVIYPQTSCQWYIGTTSVPALPMKEAVASPSLFAQAPNARSGLTDEAVPGDAAFVLPVKRQASRLSKAPHGRNKSRRSSFSASIKEKANNPPEYEVEMEKEYDDQGDDRQIPRSQPLPIYDVESGTFKRPDRGEYLSIDPRDIGRALA